MDDTAWPSSAFIVLNGSVDTDDITGAPGKNKEWARIECASKKAYGCGNHGQTLVDGISLHVRRLGDLDNLTTDLAIRLTDAALRGVEAALGAHRGGLEVLGLIKIAHRQVLVLAVVFTRRCHGKLIYYLVYDHADASLRMVPYVPRHLEVTYTSTPVPVPADGRRGHELALMAREWLPRRVGDGRGSSRLCVFSPASPAHDRTGGPWQVQALGCPELEDPLGSADATFSTDDGKVFWADLAHGLVYSDLRAAVAETAYVGLPGGQYERPEPATMNRTVGCVHGSVRFVCIERDDDCRPGDETVKVWTLDLARRRWGEDKGSRRRWRELWEQVAGFVNDDGAGLELGDVEPQYPVLMPNGAVCFLICNMRRGRRETGEEDHICSFDLRSKRPRWFGRVLDYAVTGPVILPYSLFPKCFPPLPPPSRKRKLRPAGMTRELPSISWQVSQRAARAFAQEGRD